MDAEQAVGIRAAELSHLGGHVFEEITIVADHHAGERRAREQLFEPLDTGEVEMVGGLVEQQDRGILNERFGNGQALPPAAGKTRGLNVEIVESGAPQDLGFARIALCGGHVRALQGAADQGADGRARRRRGLLGDARQPRALAHGDVAAIRFAEPCQDLQERGFPRAVRPDQPEPVALGDGERDVLKQRKGPVGFREALCI